MSIHVWHHPCCRACLSNLPLTSHTLLWFWWLLPLLTFILHNPLVVQRQKHWGYTELLPPSQTLKQVKVPGETVDSSGQTAASQGFQEHNHPSGTASHNFKDAAFIKRHSLLFSGPVMLLQKVLATADVCITISTIIYLYFVLHITLPGKAFPVWLSKTLSPITYGFLKATALRDMNRNYPPQMAVSVNS